MDLPRPAPTVAGLVDVVERSWRVPVAGARRLVGGINGIVVSVRLPDGPAVVKWVPAHGRDALVAGARAAVVMRAGGLRAGAPRPSAAGALTAPAFDGELAVLHAERGRPLTASVSDQAAWGGALAAVHRIGRCEPEGSFYDDWMRRGLQVGGGSWIGRAVEAVRSEFRSLPPLTWSLLHTDPEPGAFLEDETGDVAVIDWAGSRRGPMLYDVASAVMYAGGVASSAALLDAYRAAAVVPVPELTDRLGVLLRFRGAVQAAYFADRMTRGDLTGFEDEEGNARGLEEARRMLAALHVPMDS